MQAMATEKPGRLAGRRLLVTGAASGIGRAIAHLFVEEGARVALLDREAHALHQAADGLGAPALALSADVACRDEVAQAVQHAALVLGGLDGVVNAAGVSRRQAFGAIDADSWRQTLAVNLDGPFHVCQAALPYLVAAGAATVVNIASGVALRPVADCAAYAASKGGLVALGKALAVELAPQGIRVNTVCPGTVETPMVRRGIAAYADRAAATQRLLQRRLIQRFGRPEEIAHAVLFLTAHDCAYATGSVFAIDGGGSLH